MTVSRWLLSLALLAPLALASCGDDEPAPAPETWAPLHYDYLTKLRLNVGSIDVQDHSTPQGDGDVAAQSPTPPAQALAQMARDRLFAAGLTGHADFVIDQASIIRDSNGALTGTLAVHLDVFDASGNRVGFAQAQVSRQHVPGSDPENLRNVLYDMTRQMMDAMNVELEFQLKRSLRSLLVTGDAVPAAVTATPLQPAAPAPAAPQSTIPGVDLGPAAGRPGCAATERAAAGGTAAAGSTGAATGTNVAAARLFATAAGRGAAAVSVRKAFFLKNEAKTFANGRAR